MSTSKNGDPHKLTPRQQRFVQEYLVSGNGTKAALRSGYSSKTAYSIAYENLKKPQIQDALKAFQQKATAETIASLSERKTALTRIIRNMEPGPYSPQVAISAMEQLNRMEQVYNDRDTQSTTHNTLVLQGFTVEQLRELLAATQQKGQLQS